MSKWHTRDPEGMVLVKRTSNIEEPNCRRAAAIIPST